jgi:hypothetical protein
MSENPITSDVSNIMSALGVNDVLVTKIVEGIETVQTTPNILSVNSIRSWALILNKLRSSSMAPSEIPDCLCPMDDAEAQSWAIATAACQLTFDTPETQRHSIPQEIIAAQQQIAAQIFYLLRANPAELFIITPGAGLSDSEGSFDALQLVALFREYDDIKTGFPLALLELKTDPNLQAQFPELFGMIVEQHSTGFTTIRLPKEAFFDAPQILWRLKALIFPAD